MLKSSFKQLVAKIDSHINNFVFWIHPEKQDELQRDLALMMDAAQQPDIKRDPTLSLALEDVTDRVSLGSYVFNHFGCPFRTAYILQSDYNRPWKKDRRNISTQAFLDSMSELQSEMVTPDFWQAPPEARLARAMSAFSNFPYVMAHATPDEVPAVKEKLNEVYSNFVMRTGEQLAVPA